MSAARPTARGLHVRARCGACAVLVLLAAGCTAEFALRPHDGGPPRDAAGRDGGAATTEPVVSVPYACGGTGALDFEFQLDETIPEGGDLGTLVHVLFTEVSAAREPRVIGVSSQGLSGPKGVSSARVFSSPEPCLRADAPSPPIFAAAPARPVVDVLATEIEGLPAVITTSRAPVGFVYRDEAPPFRIDLDLEGVLAAYGAQRSVAVGDVDGDGAEDLVLGNVAEVRVAHPSTALPSHVVPGLAGAHRVWLADFDRDGRLDLLVAPHQPPPVTHVQPEMPEPPPIAPPRRLWLGDGAGGFAPAAGTDGRIDAVSPYGPVAVLDIDLDGDPDIVQWNGWSEQRAELLENQSLRGAPRFADPLRLESVGIDIVTYGEGMSGVAAVADLDLDGAPDVVMSSYGAWSMVRSGAVPRVHTISSFESGGETPDRPRVAVGDIDRDGDVDFGMVTESPPGFERDHRLQVIASRSGGARSVGIRLRGVPTAGTEVCIFVEGQLPRGGGCGGALLGHSLGVATTAQSDFASTRIFTIPAPHERVDVRVLFRAPEGAVVRDFSGLAVGAHHDITVE